MIIVTENKREKVFQISIANRKIKGILAQQNIEFP